MILNLPFIAVAVLLLIGFYGLLFKDNLIKITMSVVIIEGAVNLFLVSLGYVEGAVPPVYTMAPFEEPMAFAVPQALVITAIVIGIAVTTLMLALSVRIYQTYGTLDTKEVRRLRG